jgi:4-hydroxybutyrate CoA-transferase
MPSTAKGDSVTKIVAQLDKGACVTTSRNDVQYIVTEYGIADLRGKTLRERAKSLINIAHPDFRKSLEQEAVNLGLM